MRMVGEFIRRHHGRLAHEIALWGVPGASDAQALQLDARLGDYRDLAGAVARSHTLPIRTSVEYLRTRFAGNYRDPRSVHAPYLMGVLRVADYLQVQAERAPRALLSAPYRKYADVFSLLLRQSELRFT